MIKVRLIRKAAFGGDLAQRVAGYRHQLLSARNSHSPDVLTERAAKTRLERAIECASAEMRHFGKISQFDLRVEVDGHVTLNAARLPKLHESARVLRRCSRRVGSVVDGVAFVLHGSSSKFMSFKGEAKALQARAPAHSWDDLIQIAVVPPSNVQFLAKDGKNAQSPISHTTLSSTLAGERCSVGSRLLAKIIRGAPPEARSRKND
jgi:hypothetical protein